MVDHNPEKRIWPMVLPPVNEQIEAKFGVIQPATKIPKCTRCGEDELILIGDGSMAKCLSCNALFERA